MNKYQALLEKVHWIDEISVDDEILIEELVNKANNEPLKFEELKQGMWVWDIKYRIYLKIEELWFNGFTGAYDITSKQYRDYGVDIDNEMFESNRFYRYQVDKSYEIDW